MLGEIFVLGKRIYELRKNYNMSQWQLAEKLGISNASIAYYESNERIPPLDKLLDLCQIFDVSLDYLVGITDIPRPIHIDAKSQINNELLYLFSKIPKGQQSLYKELMKLPIEAVRAALAFAKLPLDEQARISAIINLFGNNLKK